MTLIGYLTDLGFFSEEAELGKRKKKAQGRYPSSSRIKTSGSV